MAQNLQLSKEYGEAARAYREWSQRNWQQVTDQRNPSDDRKNYYRRENLGPSKAHTNPYDSSTPVELPQTYQYYRVNRQGTYVGTNDPSINPNAIASAPTGTRWNRLAFFALLKQGRSC